MSEKSVRNHLSHLFDKLDVWTRAQAIVFARERGFMREGADGARRGARGQVAPDYTGTHTVHDHVVISTGESCATGNLSWDLGAGG